MAAGRLDIIIEQGGTFDMTLSVLDDNNQPFNLSGWTPKMTIRNVKTNSVVLTLLGSNSNGTINVSGTNTIYIEIPASRTATIPESMKFTDRVTSSNYTYAYEVIITKDDKIQKISKGIASVVKGIS